MAIVLALLGATTLISVAAVGTSIEPYLREPRTLEEAFRSAIGGESSSGGEAAAPVDGLEAVLTELETFDMGQAAYAQLNSGYHDRLECLVSAGGCIPGGVMRGPVLPERYLEPVRLGYEFKLRLGSPPETRGAEVSATSVTSYAYVALPAAGAADTWGYCVSSGPVICRFDASVPIAAPPGQCPAECEFVR